MKQTMKKKTVVITEGKTNISVVICDCCLQEIVPPSERISIDTPRADLCSQDCLEQWMNIPEKERAKRRVQAVKESREIVQDLRQRHVQRELPQTTTLKRVKVPHGKTAILIDEKDVIIPVEVHGKEPAYFRREI